MCASRHPNHEVSVKRRCILKTALARDPYSLLLCLIEVSAMLHQFAGPYPHITELVTAITHDDASVVGQGCDDQFEFEFALDLLLDGFERLRQGLP